MSVRVIGGRFRRRTLCVPRGHVRPTASLVRKAVFDVCHDRIAGVRALDIFAGSGAVGIEALSRGAASALFLEAHRDTCRCIQKNLACLGVSPPEGTVLCGKAAESLSKIARDEAQFGFIYIDPPYGRELLPNVLALVDTHRLLVPSGMLFVETSTDSTNVPHGQTYEHLKLVETRKYGTTLLVEYTTLSK